MVDPEMNDSQTVDSNSDAEQELAADYRVYGVAGSHAEIGDRFGKLYGVFGPTPDAMHPDHVAFAKACRAETEKLYAPLVEEIAALAAGAGKRADDVLWHFCLGAGAVADGESGTGAASAADVAPGTGLPWAQNPAPPAGNCSTVGVLTTDGPIVARNYDYYYFESFRHLVTTYAGGGHGHTGMWPGLAGGRYDGVNAQGVWISMHGGGARPPVEPKPGIAFHHLCRIVLETCDTAAEAVHLLRRAPHLASYNYFVADGEAMFVAEAHPEKVRVREPVNGVLVCTNHPLHPDMLDLSDSSILDNSRRRMQFLDAGALWAAGLRTAVEGTEAAGGFLDVAAEELIQPLESLMRDHTVPVCGHTDGLATFWSALCIPGQQQLAYSLGAPCRNKYVHANWP